MSFAKSLSSTISTIGLFWQDKINARLSRWNIYFIIFQLIYLFFVYDNLPPEIPLYYSRPWGESQLTSPNHLFFLPILCLVIWLLNYLFSTFYLKKNQLLSRLLVIFSLVFTILLTVALFNIINLSS